MKRIILFLILLTYYQAAYAQSIFQGVESSGSDTGNYTSNITPYNLNTDTDRYTSNIAGTNQIYSSATTADYAEEFAITVTDVDEPSNTLNAGDIAFVGYHTDSDDGFTFIALTDIPAGEVIYFTDKGWNATNAVWYTNAEDHITWTAPAGGVSMGTVISIIETSGDSFTVTHGTAFLSGSGFSLLGGDSILAYQSSSGVEPTNPTFIAGIYGDDNYVHTVGCDDAGGWLSCSTCTHVSGSCSTTSGDTSGMPAGLTNGENAIALFPNTGEADNAKYTGTLTGTVSVVRAAIHNPANWTTNQSPINIAANQYSGINITPDVSNNAPTASAFTANPSENLTYTFSTNDFGYNDSDSDPLDHVLIESVPTNGTLYLDADNDDVFDAGETVSVSQQISKADLDAGNLQYIQNGSINSSFQFEVNDGFVNSSGDYVATIKVFSRPSIISIVRNTPTSETTNANQVIFRVTFDEGVQNVDVTDFSLSGTAAADGTVSSVSTVSASVYDVTVTGVTNSNGTIKLNINGIDGTSGTNNITTAVSSAVDQSQTLVASSTGGNNFGQSFTANNSGYLTSIMIRTSAFSKAYSNATMRLFEGEGLSGSVLATETVDFEASNGLDYQTFTFTTPPAITSGEVYTIIFHGAAPFNTDVVFNAMYNDPLSGGQLYRDSSPVASNDLSFETIVSAEIPENLLDVAPTTSESYSLDNIVPAVTSFTRKNPSSELTAADQLVFLATFSKDVTGVDLNDFTVSGLTGATIAVSQLTASTYDVTVSGGDIASFNGTVGLNLASNVSIEDEAGNELSTTEPSSDQTYSIDNTAPTISSVSVPTGGSYESGDNLDFTLTFSENVNIDEGCATPPSLNITIGNTARAAQYVSGTGTSSLVFRYTVQANELDTDGIAINSFTVSDGIIDDAVGNSLVVDLPANVPSTADVLVGICAALTPANAGPDQLICESNSATLSGNTINGDGEIGTWSVVSGSGGSFSDVNDPAATFTGIAGRVYVLRWTSSNSLCSNTSTDDVEIAFLSANAGADQSVCGTNTFLSASAISSSTGSWSILSGAGGSITTPSSTNSSFSGVAGTTYTLQWEETNGSCSDTDTVEITFYDSVTAAAAGADQEVCSTSTTLAANAASGFSESGTWSVLAGAGGSFADVNNPTSTFTGARGVSYTLRWTISNGVCPISSDDVVITFNQDVIANAGADQSVCGTQTFLGASYSTGSTGSWSILSGAGGSVTTPSSNTSKFTGTVGTTYTLQWTENNGSCSDNDTVKITFFDNPTPANAGLDKDICGPTALSANAASGFGETGTWSVVSGAGGSFSDVNSPTATFTGTEGVNYTLRWTISNGVCPISSDDVVITVEVNDVEANAGSDQNVCGTQTFLGAVYSTGSTGSWSILSGAGGSVTTPSSNTSKFTGTVGTTYTLQWTENSGTCSDTDIVEITFLGNVTVAAAGADQETCNTSVTMAANAASGFRETGTWSVVSGAGGSFADANSPTSSFTGTKGVSYTLRWTISNGVCPISSDDVVVTLSDDVEANAGSDQNVCGTNTFLGASFSTGSTGTWSILSGAGGTVTTPTSNTSAFTGTAGTTYTLQWTENNGSCSDNDTVKITFFDNPTPANAGLDKDICGPTALSANAASGFGETGTWSVVAGAGGSFSDVNSPTATFTGTEGVNYTLRWTISNGVCPTSSDDVVITVEVNDVEANAGSDQNVCGTQTFLGAVYSTGSTGSWSILSGAGGSVTTPSSNTSKFTGTVGTTYTLQWTENSGSCSDTDIVEITFLGNVTVAAAGSDQETCNTSVTMAANAASGFRETGTWSVVSGAGGSFADANSPTSSFTGTKGVSYTLRWTISNGVCPISSDDVVVNLSDDVEANAGSDQNVCGTNTFLGASYSTGNTGSWSILSGAGGTITTPTSNTSAFTGTAGTTYTLQWTENNGSCSGNDTVKITFFDNVTVAAAGADQEIDGALATMNATLAGNTASGFSETGTWSEVAGDGNGVFSDANSPTSTFTGTVGVTYTLRWTISNGVCPISSDDVVIEFVNNAGFTITETASSTEVDESGATDTFNVVLDSEPASDVVINVSSGSTSEVTVDQSSLTFTSGNWNVPQTVTVQGVDDSKVDTDKSVKITLSIDDAASHDNYDAVIDQSVSVTNENTTTASVTVADVSVAEADGTATVTFTLDDAVEGGLSVDVSTTNGTATGGVDFSPITTQTITFDGTAGETETLDISITADAIVEADETITVSMSGLTPATAASTDIDITDEATVTITNDDVAVITIADVTISEDAGTGTATLTLDKAVAATFDVYVNSAAGTAGHNDDFTEVFNEIASFAGTAGETQTINFTVLDDDVVELDETFRLLLSSVTNTSLNNDDFNLTDEATVTITNDDAATLAIDDVAKAENADGTTTTLTFTVTLTGDVNQGITVDFATSDGTALSTSDYTSGSGTLNFAGTDGETQTLSVVVSDDDLVEADETFDVTLSNLLAGGRKVSISDATGVGTITNDDQASITMADVMVNEEDGTATVILTLDNAIDGGVSVNVSTADETATAGTDFTALVNEQVTFAGTEGETQTVTVSITDDAMVEADETITVSMSGLTPATAASADIDITDEATVTINNTDRATVTIADASGAEANGAITLTATLDNAVDGGFFVELNTADVTALSTSDYTALISQKLTFSGLAGEQQTFTITPTDDNIEESTETLTVSMSNISAGTVDENNIDITDGATITITDEDDNTAPVGYSITLNDALIGSAETATTTFTFAGAEIGTTYNYTVSSDNGGTNVTGSGTIATATDQVTLADLSGLNDGTLTLSLTLTDASSNVGTAVTAQTTIDQTMEATLSPADDAIDVLPDAKLSMDFGENVYKGMGNITIAQSSNDEVLETIDVTSTNVVVNGSEVTIAPTNLLLPPSTEFYVSIEIGAITDDAGNSYSGATNKTAWTFTTIAAPVVTATTVPTADTYAIGDKLTFETSFTLPVTITGTPSLPITIGTETKAATLSGTVSESNIATFTYTIAEGDLDTDGITVGSAIDLNGATIVGEFGTDAILTLNNTASTAAINVDGIRAIPTLSTATGSLTNEALTVTVAYDEQVTGLELTDFTIANGTASDLSVVTAGLVWTATVTPSADGAVSVTLPAGTVNDQAGNTSAASANTISTTFDGTAPAVSSIARAEADQLNTADTDANFTVTFSEDVIGVDVADFETVVTGTATASINSVTAVDAKTYTVNVNGISGQGTVGLSAKADASIIDAATNAFSTAASGDVYTTNYLPTAIGLSSSSIEENSTIGSLVGTFTTTDQDAGDSHTYTLVAGTGDTDNASFSINGDQLLTAEAFDFETKDSYSIRVKTDDGNGATFEQELTITVDNVLEASITVTGEEMFEETILGFSTTKTWFVENNGEVPVEIRVSEAAAGFSVQPGSFVLGVGGSREISLVFTPEEARAYAGTITFDYEGGAPVTMNVSGSGVIVTDIDDQLMDEATINIYPNPASTVVTLDLTELYGLPVDVNIYSTTGQPMFNRAAVTESKLQVDVSSYESGVYIVRFSNGNSVVNKKVMIKR
ncbi:putative secreted protein (Por secretion system target) [Roseivirga pacifica]|uniref:Calx-beta domain-containing protein n=1 Tax=Roseivirga pacifica TaxID=1267423 RepID=UPI000EB602BF|nr:Calx-beta domain-containing protein [Roseivirga pacifica]RKQ42681.1 putative secreted protein (Por secretion system target) [Roseivirga pacifica]